MIPLKIPLYMQGIKTAYCVPYSIFGILRYYGINVNKQELITACKSHIKYGSSPKIYSKAVKQFGIKFERINFNYKTVKRLLMNETPVVISFVSSTDDTHFTTIINAFKNDRGIRFYTINDTYYGEWTLPVSILEYLVKQDSSWTRKVVKI